MSGDELQQLRAQERADRKLMRRAAETLAELDRAQGLSDVQADVLAALRIRVEGKKRASLDELLGAAGDIAGKRDLADALHEPGEDDKDWPEITDKKRDWPT